MSDEPIRVIDLTSDVVAAYVGNNAVAMADLPTLIAQVHGALTAIAIGVTAVPEASRGAPAVSIKKSLTPDHLICLEDGRKFKSLKRHLRTDHSQTPDQYRVRWGLPRDYPMVAPAYSEARSQLAKKSGLGQLGRERRDAAKSGVARGKATKTR